MGGAFRVAVFPPFFDQDLGFAQGVEALNSKIRRAVRTRGHFPSDDAAAKLIYLALNATSVAWKRCVREWHRVKANSPACSKNAFPWRN
ncbi:transposase [Sulfitobacter sp. 1A12057]|uniref:transposase n=1 Tax=Sulfitobacter sp. 1A12057 TaxID=3368567 RepID=UPI003745F08B